jgi:chemotaxis protein CheD
MKNDSLVMDVFLQPGEYYFGDQETRIRTLLGSCVAITMWHPERRIGGMCHCLLPERAGPAQADGLDGRYVDEAIAWLLCEAVRDDSNPADYHVKLFGGGNMFGKLGVTSNVQIGNKNAITAQRILAGIGLSAKATDLGGQVHRSLIFEVGTGDVWVKRGTNESDDCERAELAA